MHCLVSYNMVYHSFLDENSISLLFITNQNSLFLDNSDFIFHFGFLI
jgi:hypothetical protein